MEELKQEKNGWKALRLQPKDTCDVEFRFYNCKGGKLHHNADCEETHSWEKGIFRGPLTQFTAFNINTFLHSSEKEKHYMPPNLNLWMFTRSLVPWRFLQKLFESHLFAQHLKNKKVLVCFFCWSPDASHPPEEKSLTQIKSKHQKKFLCYKVKPLFSAAGRASIRLRWGSKWELLDIDSKIKSKL